MILTTVPEMELFQEFRNVIAELGGQSEGVHTYMCTSPQH